MPSAARVLGALGRRTGGVARRGRALARFARDLAAFRKQAAAATTGFAMGRLYPCLDDFEDAAGSASGPYFHQDLWVAQRIFATNPRHHVDVGSRIDGFVAHVASFRSLEVLDVRPLAPTHPAIRFRQVDVMDAGSVPEAICDSLSCLHALEHFGLGRYGDPVDAQGHRKGFASLVRMLEPGGRLHVSVPIGPPRVEFNAHRVFAIGMVLDLARPALDLEAFSYVDDRGDFHPRVPVDDALLGTDAGCRLGCGIFEFRRR